MAAKTTLSRCFFLSWFFVLAAYPAQAQQGKKPEVVKFEDRDVQWKTSVFSGNESRLGVLGGVQADCSVLLPDIRISKQPAKGEVRLDQTRAVISLTKDNNLATCNGRDVGAVGVFYKSKDDFTGEDRLILDVDYKVGIVRQLTFVINVR